MPSVETIWAKVVNGGVLSPAERLWLDCEQTLLLAARTYNGPLRWARVSWYEAWLRGEYSAGRLTR